MHSLNTQSAVDVKPAIPELKIDYRSPASLTPNPKNPRKHSDKQEKHLARSMQAFGFLVPALVNATGEILAGHCRVRVAQRLGMPVIPVICVDHLTPDQAKAFMLADNRLSEMSDWNDDLLAEVLRELKMADFDLETTGFTLDEIDARIEDLDIKLGNVADPDDEAPDLLSGPAISIHGDLWLLGQNRLLHGDATKKEDFDKLMAGQQADLTFTDPPYNANYGSSAKDEMRGTHRPILNDNLGEGFGEFLYQTCLNIVASTKGSIYMCMSSAELHVLQQAFFKAGGHWSTFIIWAKNTFTLGRADYQRQYEPILYGWREGTERYWCGARDQGDVWFINKPTKNDLHPTMKPVELVMRALRNSSQRGEIVLDPFMGSGSTLIAAERTERICYGMELDPPHVDTIIRRWQQHTGKQAVHAASGRNFDEIASEKGSINA